MNPDDAGEVMIANDDTRWSEKRKLLRVLYPHTNGHKGVTKFSWNEKNE